MKKLITLCCTMLAVNFLFAQNPIPNPGFETWINYGPYVDPDSWTSLNQDTWPFGAFTVKQDNSSASGLYSAKLSTIGHNNIAYAGLLCSGDSISFSSFTCYGEFAVSAPYGSFNGMYKYAPALVDTFGTPDTCVMFAMLTKWNQTDQVRDTVAVATYFGGTAENYTMFGDTFNYHIAEIPDSAQVVITTTKHPFNAPLGSILLVDDLSFSNIVGIDEINAGAPKVFPNPANETIRFQVASSLHARNVLISDVVGRKLAVVPLSDSQQTISTATFHEGIFFYTIRDDANKIIASGKFVVKH